MEPNSKKDTKIDKISRKRQIISFQNSNPTQNKDQDQNVEYNGSTQQIVYIDHYSQSKKARQWWNNLDNTYFKKMKLKDILLSRDLTSSEKLINFFNSQGQLQSSFVNQQIIPNYYNFSQNTLIQVLFKSSTPFYVSLFSYSFVNYTSNITKKTHKIIREEQQQLTQPTNCSVYYQNKSKLYSNHDFQFNIEQNQIQQVLKNGNLQFIGNLSDQNKVLKLQRSQEVINKFKYEQQIDVEIQLWRIQAERQNTQNSILWNKLIYFHQNNQNTQIQKNKDLSTQIFSIRQSLIHHTILRYFQHGTKDKTNLMLKTLIQSLKLIKPAKTRDSSNKKFFETDCKICFCSFNYDSNQVLYCDQCNTSFHLACYGLHQLPQSKQYFCDCCLTLNKEEKLKGISLRKITCQICCKSNFPIKQIDGHYYHMTCLVIFNFITIKNGKIQFKEGLSHEVILKKVIQSQIECQSCVFCSGFQGGQSGMQFKCSYPGCTSSMHPICAYINGCLFQVKKNMEEKKLDVKILCNKHDCQRDYIQQTYLRRYMCNFKNTSQKTLQLFKSEYEAQGLLRKQRLESRIRDDGWLPRLIIETKVIKRHIAQRQQKNIQKMQQTEPTQTRKMLEKLVGKRV